MDEWWIAGAKLVTPNGIVDGAVCISRRRIVALRRRAPKSAQCIDVPGTYVAPGFIDLHVWGDPLVVSREAVKGGTTAFLSTLGPSAPSRLVAELKARVRAIRRGLPGAACLGFHLEGPFLNADRAGALSQRWMRNPRRLELAALARAAAGHLKLVTLAPELTGALAAIGWCRRRRIVASLGHSQADAETASRAVRAGASAVTHIFNGMRPFHHRAPSLLDVALGEPRLFNMVIADGVHVSPFAFRWMVRAKTTRRVVLVTDSIEYEGGDVIKRGGAYYTTYNVLAGSCLTMIRAVQNAIRFGRLTVLDAVRMASEVPARLLGLGRSAGMLTVGRRADLVAFDHQFRVQLTVVNGRIVYRG